LLLSGPATRAMLKGARLQPDRVVRSVADLRDNSPGK